MVLEYTLSAAAVARGFRAYGATLLGFGPEAGLVRAGPLALVFCALGLVAALSALLALSTADSAAFNSGARAAGAPVTLLLMGGEGRREGTPDMRRMRRHTSHMNVWSGQARAGAAA